VRTAVRIGLAALAGSSGGAFLAAGMSTEVLKPVIMVVLLAVAAFVILRPAFGTTAPAPGPVSRRRTLAAIGLAGLGIGFYDGLVGPGTGTFLVLALTALLHLDLVTASATAKIVNCCTNAGALAMFAWQGAVLWQLAGLMAVFNLAGGTLGAHTALKRGSGVVRVVLLVVVFALVANPAYDQWLAWTRPARRRGPPGPGRRALDGRRGVPRPGRGRASARDRGDRGPPRAARRTARRSGAGDGLNPGRGPGAGSAAAGQVGVHHHVAPV